MPTARTHPRLRTAVRKTVKWGGAGLTVLLVGVWIGSGWWYVFWVNTGGGLIGVGVGQLRISVPVFGHGSGVFSAYQFKPNERDLEWWFDWMMFMGRRIAKIPLWFPALLSLLATAAAWRADAKYLRRARVGLCAGCGYDRAGLAAGCLCPECGAAAGA